MFRKKLSSMNENRESRLSQYVFYPATGLLGSVPVGEFGNDTITGVYSTASGAPTYLIGEWYDVTGTIISRSTTYTINSTGAVLFASFSRPANAVSFIGRLEGAPRYLGFNGFEQSNGTVIEGQRIPEQEILFPTGNISLGMNFVVPRFEDQQIWSGIVDVDSFAPQLDEIRLATLTGSGNLTGYFVDTDNVRINQPNDNRVTLPTGVVNTTFRTLKSIFQGFSIPANAVGFVGNITADYYLDPNSGAFGDAGGQDAAVNSRTSMILYNPGNIILGRVHKNLVPPPPIESFAKNLSNLSTSNTLAFLSLLSGTKLRTTEQNSYYYTAAATGVQLKVGLGTLKTVTIGETASGTVTLFDNTTAVAGTEICVLKANIVEGTYHFNAVFTNGLRLVTTAASKVTVTFE